MEITITDEFLSIVRCPQNRSPLTAAGEDLLARVNQAVGDQRLTNQSGKRVERPIEGGLVRAEGDVLYPILDGIPLLLWDESIILDQLPD